MKSKFFEPKKPRIFAHRGHSAAAPENSLQAFESALKHCPYIETDLHSLADGTLVFHHDEDLLRSCGVNKRLNEINLKDLKSLKLFGSSQSIPVAAEALKAFPNALWNIEIKDPREFIEHDVLAMLKTSGAADHTLIAAENDSIMKRFRALQCGIPTSAAQEEMLNIVQWMMAGAREKLDLQAQAFQLPLEAMGIRLDQPELIALAHQHNIEVHYWTINDPGVARRLAKIGADGIITDDPPAIATNFKWL